MILIDETIPNPLRKAGQFLLPQYIAIEGSEQEGSLQTQTSHSIEIEKVIGS